jgi:hypothetical protein
MVHELPHQWFGDDVAPVRWSDVWLNEGHATWYEWSYAESIGSTEGTGLDFLGHMRAAYAAGDQWRHDFGPVARPIHGADDVARMFSPNIYDGGALVLYALRQVIGERAFERLERAWVTLYGGRSTSTQDFVRLASRVAHRDLRAFLDDWLYGTETPPMPGHPDWTVEPVNAAVPHTLSAARLLKRGPTAGPGRGGTCTVPPWSASCTRARWARPSRPACATAPPGPPPAARRRPRSAPALQG